MFPVTSRVTCVCATPGVYRLYYQSRRIGEAVTIDIDALYVSHSSTENGRVVRVAPRTRPAGSRRSRKRTPLISPLPDRPEPKDIALHPGATEEQRK